MHVTIAVLAAIEGLLFFFAPFIGALIRFPGSLSSIQMEIGPLWQRSLLFAGCLLLSFVALGLYTARQRARVIGLFLRIVAAVLAGTAGTAIVFYLVPSLEVGRGIIAIAAFLSFLGSCIARATFTRLIDNDVFKRRVLVYGVGQRASAIATLRRRTDRRGYILVGFVIPSGEDIFVPRDQIIGGADRLSELCPRLGVDEVIVAMDDRRRSFPIQDLLQCRLTGIEVTDLVTFLERETGRVRLDVLNPSWMIFGHGFKRGPIRLFTARLIDIIASAVILVVTMPIMLITALAILVEDRGRGGIFYRQDRVGYGGHSFQLLKFRSMRTDAEVDGQARWAEKNDPRVTGVGSVIRRLRIDELPQVINVLRGDMSFVGPRPERPQFVAELAEKIPYYVQRHSVKPGITGWAQLCYPYGSSEHDALQKLQYDLYYIKNNSFLFDLAILVQTAEVVFMGKGAR